MQNNSYQKAAADDLTGTQLKDLFFINNVTIINKNTGRKKSGKVINTSGTNKIIYVERDVTRDKWENVLLIWMN